MRSLRASLRLSGPLSPGQRAVLLSIVQDQLLMLRISDHEVQRAVDKALYRVSNEELLRLVG